MPSWFYFLLTLLLEMPIVLLFFRRQWRFALLIGFLLNMFTWPLLHILLYYTGADINLLEVGVAITEGIGYWIFMRCSWYKAFGVAFLVNGFSYGLGLILTKFIE